MKSIFNILASLACALAFTACGGNDDAPVTTPAPDVVTKVDLAVGTGIEAISGDTVTVAYTGWLYDETKTENKGTQIDQATAANARTFKLGTGTEVIAGWHQGIVGMRVGGKRRLTIPPSLAYGAAASDKVPANSKLVFEIEMLAIKR